MLSFLLFIQRATGTCSTRPQQIDGARSIKEACETPSGG